MNHLENLISEFYDWKGYLVKRNVKVGRRAKGGWEMELDVVAYHPHNNHLIHLEASLDANTWEKRESRFEKKFAAAKKYIFKEVFTWLDNSTPIEQVAILSEHPKSRDKLAGRQLKSADELMSEIKSEIKKRGTMFKSAIPELYPLLRTLQLSHCGYHRVH
ncbi:MAG TPA: hypothetical protein VHP63_03410 [candidate division Zixibacteria bacterium]|nr:hypothetical protein [candidate division Zixibacteria bacterium]